MNAESGQIQRDPDGYLPLRGYGAVGDGRSVALSGTDGSIDWWCVPNLDSPPLFDRLLDANVGGFFAITPLEPYSVRRRYRRESNVLETQFTTASGSATITDSLNSSGAGRLPWAELARRIDGMQGSLTFEIHVCFGRRGDTVAPYCSVIGGRDVFHAGDVLGLVLRSTEIALREREDGHLIGEVTVASGERRTLAIVAGQDEPLVVPDISEIDARIDRSDQAWSEWASGLDYQGPHRELLVRSALALKLLLYSPSGAIAAAATTSLPERIGDDKNFDYRYAWVRDAGYTIKAFLRIGAQEEAKAAFSWLLSQMASSGARVMYALSGGVAEQLKEIQVDGYRGSRPVNTGNAATDQLQLGVYGDIFGTAAVFVENGNILDSKSALILSRLADQCADDWRKKDSGIWELAEQQHYTISKLSAWEALARAVDLADGGQLPTTRRDRWQKERDRIATWISEEGWSETRGAYVMYPGSEKLDASLALTMRFRFDGKDRIRRTLDAIQSELGSGPYHYRYSGMEKEEGCFLACTFWQIEARALLGDTDAAASALAGVVEGLANGSGIYPEMVDPLTHEFLGNLPQGLTHLAAVQAIATLS